MTNEQKAKFIADQCKPCTADFYSGIEQGVLLALNSDTSPRLASDMTIREKMIKDIYCSLLISEQNTGIKTICEYLEIGIEEYKWAIHFPAFIRKMATKQADALINALNEKQ